MIDVLVIGNDSFSCKFIKYILESDRLDVQIADNLAEAYQLLKQNPPLLLIQAYNKSDEDSLAFCKKLLSEGNDIPIIFISPNTNLEFKIEILKYTTDYITRPFEPLELLARTKAILRRIKFKQQQRKQEQLNVSGVTLLFNNLEVRVPQRCPVFLTPSEARILGHLMRHAGGIVSRENLKAELLNEKSSTSNVIDVCISRIRQKIELNPTRPVYIETVKGLGYRFNILGIKQRLE